MTDQKKQKEDLSPEDKRKKMHINPQGSHKEKARENLEQPEGEGHMQGSKAEQGRKIQKNNVNRSPQEFDRNEGQQHKQF